MRRIRVTHVIVGLHVGGAENTLLKLIRFLPRTEFDQQVISLTSDGELKAEILKNDSEVHEIGMTRGMVSAPQFSRLIRLVRSSRPDIVQTWMYHADLLGGMAARMARSGRVVWNIRHSNLDLNANRLSTLLVAKASAFLSRRIPDRIISNAGVASERHIRFGYDPKRILVIHNGVDTDTFRPVTGAGRSVREEHGFSAETPLVVHFGRFHPQKDHVTLVATAERIARQRPDCGFLFVGDGVDSSNRRLRAWIASAGIGARVRLLSYRKDIARIASAADVVVSSSVGEGFPNAVAESMACGAPCVVTDVGDSALLVGDPGQVAASGDAEGLARQTLRILALDSEVATALRERTRRRIVEEFSIRKFLSQYRDLYRSLATERVASA